MNKMNLHKNGEENRTEREEMTIKDDNRRGLTHVLNLLTDNEEGLSMVVIISSDNPGSGEEDPDKGVPSTGDGHPQEQNFLRDFPVLPGVIRRWSVEECGSTNTGHQTQNFPDWAANQEALIWQDDYRITPDDITTRPLRTGQSADTKAAIYGVREGGQYVRRSQPAKQLRTIQDPYHRGVGVNEHRKRRHCYDPGRRWMVT